MSSGIPLFPAERGMIIEMDSGAGTRLEFSISTAAVRAGLDPANRLGNCREERLAFDDGCGPFCVSHLPPYGLAVE
jgi:hypothetical protein